MSLFTLAASARVDVQRDQRETVDILGADGHLGTVRHQCGATTAIAFTGAYSGCHVHAPRSASSCSNSIPTSIRRACRLRAFS